MDLNPIPLINDSRWSMAGLTASAKGAKKRRSEEKQIVLRVFLRVLRFFAPFAEAVGSFQHVGGCRLA
jgi:hypothetical protein